MSPEYLSTKYLPVVLALDEEKNKTVWQVIAVDAYNSLLLSPLSKMKKDIMVREFDAFAEERGIKTVGVL